MVKALSKVLYHGVKIFISSVRKSILQEIELSRELAKIRYQTQKTEIERACNNMSLQEAQQVLNITLLDPKEAEKRFKYLFSANKEFKYLQSKVFRAKEVIDRELLNSRNALMERGKTRKQLGRNGNFLFFSYFLISDKSGLASQPAT
ncbi:hypothetical protein HUJ04_008871 [Dendroctonus ponderosae]|nr:hypothetical protein HUJ04_008871 [Dendroctonus ponderosae]